MVWPRVQRLANLAIVRNAIANTLRFSLARTRPSALPHAVSDADCVIAHGPAALQMARGSTVTLFE